MIELNYKTEQDFLSVDKMERLVELGVNLSDAKYTIIKSKSSGTLYVVYGNSDWESNVVNPEYYEEVTQTYTLAELLYKLPEWLTKDGYKELSFYKDAPFYAFYYSHKDAEKQDDCTFPIEYPIHSAFCLLVWCIMHGHGYAEDVSSK